MFHFILAYLIVFIVYFKFKGLSVNLQEVCWLLVWLIGPSEVEGGYPNWTWQSVQGFGSSLNMTHNILVGFGLGSVTILLGSGWVRTEICGLIQTLQWGSHMKTVTCCNHSSWFILALNRFFPVFQCCSSFVLLSVSFHCNSIESLSREIQRWNFILKSLKLWNIFTWYDYLSLPKPHISVRYTFTYIFPQTVNFVPSLPLKWC